MPLLSHTTAGAGRPGTLLRSQPDMAARGLRTWADRRPGRYRAADPAASRADSTSQSPTSACDINPLISSR
jgi:hypothetical protein